MARPLTRAKFRGWFGEDCDCDVIRVKRGELMDSYIEEHGIEAKAGAGELLAFLKENGIGSAFHYVPLHSSKAGRRFGRFHGEDVYTTKESERLLRLPMFYNLPMEDARFAASCVLSFPDFA